MKTIVLHITEDDKPYLNTIKPFLSGRVQTRVDNMVPSIAYEYVMKAKQYNATIVSTSQKLLELVLPDAIKPKISNYSGSLVQYRDAEFLFIDPLKQLVTTPTGKFITKRYLDKLLAPEQWIVQPDFKWELFDPTRLDILYDFFEHCILIGCDIETVVDDPLKAISCISFSGIQVSGAQLKMMTVCVPLDDVYNLQFTRLILSGPAPKVFQNGKYDIAYLLRFNCPVTNYSFDTINLFHSWLSELPKDLGFISAFMLRNYTFHKNDAKTGGKLDYYAYNAMDAYTTVLTCMALLLEIPEYAISNFSMEFPVVFPCILSEHTGLKWDNERAVELKKRVEEDMDKERRKIQVMVATPNFNPNSPQQTLKLFHVLGSKDIQDTTPSSKDKVAARHPLNKLLVDGIVNYRENSKLRGSYFKEGVEWKGRVFYALNPHGTDTGRLASRESQFWCGLQIQNIPREDEDGVSVKEAFVADEGFYFGEADYSQAEARGTAYLSGDTNLIVAVDDETTDFHGRNASAFFGVPYEKIVSSKRVPVIDETGNIVTWEWIHKTIDKALRDLSKRTNHGANYNMGAQVMLDTMGYEKVLKAKALLKLPSHWAPLRVTEYLLTKYAETYPVVKDQHGGWYGKVINDVCNTGLLVGPTGWTRKCFGNPKTNKRHLNSYVAHPPQSLNAMILNKAYINVFRNVYLPNPQDFKLYAQIHDSILFGYRKGRQDLAWKVAECMKIPVEVTDTFGVKRTLIVPVDVKGEATRWSETKALKKPHELLAA